MSKIRSKHLLGTGLAAITIAAVVAVTEARADTFAVYTGYADSLRASGFFPTPWLGDPGIVSQTAKPSNPVGVLIRARSSS